VIFAQCRSNCLCSALSQRIGAKVERRHSGIHAQCRSNCLSSALSQFTFIEAQLSNPAPRVQAVQLVQQPFAIAELDTALTTTTSTLALSTAARIVFDVRRSTKVLVAGTILLCISCGSILEPHLDTIFLLYLAFSARQAKIVREMFEMSAPTTTQSLRALKTSPSTQEAHKTHIQHGPSRRLRENGISALNLQQGHKFESLCTGLPKHLDSKKDLKIAPRVQGRVGPKSDML
jgi:hypothetical protein